MSEPTGFDILMRVENYLVSMSDEAATAEMFSFQGDSGLYYWYKGGLDMVSAIVDDIPLVVVNPDMRN